MSLNFPKLTLSLSRDELLPYKNLLKTINDLEFEVKQLNEEQIKEKIRKIQLEVNDSHRGVLSNKQICDIFAITREASYRAIGLRPFDTQILGGLILNDGFITEMKTGEGKTLVATLPAVCQSLFKKGTHIVTVNEYLAKRDCEWMGKIFENLGLTTGLIQSQMNYRRKRENYAKDITYVTNSELGFDYLRDNLAENRNELVLRKLNYCIIDEVDSILIDEARTPLIISGDLKVDSEKYYIASEAINYVKEGIDYEVNEKTKSIILTERGTQKFENFFEVLDLFSVRHSWLSYAINAIKAKTFYRKNIDYIVKNNEILIVDEFTGRILSGRRWSEGLHQSIEAKENVTVKNNSVAVASVTYQNFFLLYEKFAGMTGTAKSSEIEFSKIYGTKVYQVPTARPVIRKDCSDIIFSDEVNKWKAVATECAKMYNIGRPVLVGTTSIENSELLSQLLHNYSIKHNVLNAKPENAEKESEIIAEAGCFKSVTIATNMAGRGTDILLGGNSKLFSDYKLTNHFTILAKNFVIPTEEILNHLKTFSYFRTFLFPILNEYITTTNLEVYCQQLNSFVSTQVKLECSNEASLVRNLGGLYVIGTERHDSKRIDDQLRGRAGRQGDPGSSRFFLSLKDKLLRLFGSDQIRFLLQTIDPLDDAPLSFDFLTDVIDRAQQRVENYNYGIRKDLFQYDQILDVHRKLIYRERQLVLRNKHCRGILVDYLDFLVKTYHYKFFGKGSEKLDSYNYRLQVFKYLISLNEALFVNLTPTISKTRKFSKLKLLNFTFDQAWISYDLKESEIEIYDKGLLNTMERYCILQSIDETWKKHLSSMANLRESSMFAGFGQTEPISEYRKVSAQRFVTTLEKLRLRAVFNYIHAETLYRRFKIKKRFKLNT